MQNSSNHQSIRLSLINLALLIPLLSSVVITSCTATSPHRLQSTPAGRQSLEHSAEAAKVEFLSADPGLKQYFDGAVGYAIFPSIGKGAVVIGGAYGEGVVYDKNTLVGYADLTQATIGFQLGGQSFREVIFFNNKSALGDFEQGKFKFSANASAVAVTAGVSGAGDYSHGVAVFTMAKGGLMYEASIGGQKFSFQPK